MHEKKKKKTCTEKDKINKYEKNKYKYELKYIAEYNKSKYSQLRLR